MEKNQETVEPLSNNEDNSFYRVVKTYVLRIGRMTQAQERDYNELSPVFCIPFENKKINFLDIFGNTNPIVVEIGFGMGAATAEIAEKNPHINYIGIEVHKPGVGRLLGEIRKRDLKNLYIIEYDAIEVLEKMFVDGSINGFHIFFPDPWPKKRHHKRRLVQSPFIKQLVSRLKPGGYIHCATDWEDYAMQMMEVLSSEEALQNRFEGFAPRPDYRPLTKFENRGIKLGYGVWDLIFEKK